MTEAKGNAPRRKRDQERRARALRANLARRKTQALARKAPAEDPPPPGGGRGRE
jgi:hypothetical protein